MTRTLLGIDAVGYPGQGPRVMVRMSNNFTCVQYDAPPRFPACLLPMVAERILAGQGVEAFAEVQLLWEKATSDAGGVA